VTQATRCGVTHGAPSSGLLRLRDAELVAGALGQDVGYLGVAGDCGGRAVRRVAPYGVIVALAALLAAEAPHVALEGPLVFVTNETGIRAEARFKI
jgi:hypothetical protein